VFATSGQSTQAEGLGDPIYVRVCQQLRRDIVAGVFAPGHRLKIAELTKRYGVSQMPIREALQQLQGEWLITILPNRGAAVRNVDEDFVSDMYEIRGHIEAFLTRRCAERVRPEQLGSLRDHQADCRKAVRRRDYATFLEANSRFHTAIYDISGSVVGKELVMHFGLLQALRNQHGFGKARLHDVISEHEQILEALGQRDPERAQSVAYRHCLGARNDLLERMRRHERKST
jgi:DNA-binding GntR family transcriptional regulator